MATRPGGHPYGALIRRHRLKHRLTIRDLAAEIGISHAFLGAIEIGRAGPMSRAVEPKLLQALPSIPVDDLADARTLSEPVQITLSNTPDGCAALTRALAFRYSRRDLTPNEIRRLVRLLLRGRSRFAAALLPASRRRDDRDT